MELPIICAGDWNLTYSTLNSADNIDIINMPLPPSYIRSEWLATWCEELQCGDPFRALHYDKRDFTYVPRTGKRNRSRIDFFIISDCLLSLCNKCWISDSLNSVLFDHKSIHLEFTNNMHNAKIFIDNSIFKHPRCSAVLAAAAVETYLQHATPLQEGLNIQEGLHSIGNIINKIRQANETEFEIAFGGRTQQLELRLAGLNTEINLLVAELLEPEHLNLINLTATPDSFLEILMGNIRNALTSFQTWIKKVKNSNIQVLVRTLHELKKDYVTNFDQITEIESSLCRIREDSLNDRIRELKIFDNLHNEKASPLFLRLLKCSSRDSLSGIKDQNGTPFKIDRERNDYIVGYYERIYTQRAVEDESIFNDCINKFLGPEIINNPVVRDSKLSDE
jgi:hypothetical protein